MTPQERIALYREAFSSEGGDALVGNAQIAYIVEALTGKREEIDSDGIDLRDIAWSFESLAIESMRSGSSEKVLIDYFDTAFQLRASLLVSENKLSIHDLWMLIASGVSSQNQPQLRDILGDFTWTNLFGTAPASWDERVLWEASHALFCLARKKHGWEDIDEAISALNSLVELQAEYEPSAMNSESDDSGRQDHSARLLGLYHLAEGLTTLGEYLRTGLPESVMPTIERHAEHARFLLARTKQSDLSQIGSAAAAIFPQLVRASIWFNANRLSQAARQFARRLASEERDNPVLELWWGQREALAQNLLDPFKVAIGVQMPTSAGKTLLAEFSIIQTLALNPGSMVAYIVPTRALVNQVTRRLRHDLEGEDIGQRSISVEAAVPVFELDPTEDAMLTNRPDILVTTPEKLDLLVRSQHACVRDLSLVVVDEAHLISEPSRGPRLELLLATLKRERGTTCRYLLLTPFLPNADELARWLGDADNAAISLDWRPSLQVRAAAQWKRRNKKYYDSLKLIPSLTQPSEWSGVEIELGEAHVQPSNRSRPGISASTAIAMSSFGRSCLVLTRGQGTAESRATAIASILADENQEAPHGDELSDAISYIEAELGTSHALAKSLRQGVAFHHAGLPPEVRILVETLIEKGLVRIVTGTTTLAQGVNFPLASVIVESLSVPQGRGKTGRALQYSEFWNIAGRAGRALQDRVGTVIWPANNADSMKEFEQFLAGEAAQVVSALAETLSRIDDLSTDYTLQLVRNNPNLSHFLQYLAHALRVGGFAQASAEIEDILRSSLVFHRIRADDRDAAESLIRWSRGFMEVSRDRALLEVADTTGLSLPSVGLLSSTASPEMHDPEFWLPQNLFGRDIGGLTRTVELLAEVPEFSLGLSDEPGGINAGRVAGILRDWVNGASLPQLVHTWFPGSEEASALRDVGRYLFRELTGQMPWGLGALQLVSMSASDANPAVVEARRVPAMAYYGVRTRGAVALRMIGVPRAAAEGLGAASPAFTSFSDARDWVKTLPVARWDQAGSARQVSGAVLRRVWEMTST
ncbi:hypothetical protein GCM10010182_61220 [Actinomadura cremea]|nr:hypothetical protein GCM10010182_61220 [Actinomadura cremea]